jgi:hypothetical protein
VANGINDFGQIVGSFKDADGHSHGFLAIATWHGPEPIFTGASGNPSIVQAIPGTYGTKGNYELVVPLESGGLGHFYRDNDDPNLSWNGPFPFATDQGSFDAVSLIQSSFTRSGSGPGNLAVVARIGDALDYFVREDVSFTWSGPTTITTGVSGVASFVQATPGTYGTVGNYELVVPLAGGSIGAFECNNDDPNLPWSQTDTFGSELGSVDAVSLIQSNFSTQFVQTGEQGPGNLAVVARVRSKLYYFYRDDVAPFAWHGPSVAIALGVSGNPALIQARAGTYGSKGTYELLVPMAGGGIGQFERSNDDPNLPWSSLTNFGTILGTVEGVSLLQSNFSTQFVQTGVPGPGNLAVVSVSNGQLSYFYRDDQ